MRSVALLSEFGLGHVREYAPFSLILLCVPGALRAPCPQRLASHPSFKVSAHLRQMCGNGTSCNILTFANLQKITFVGPLKMVDKPRGRIHHSEYIVCWFRLVGFGLFGGSCHGVNAAGHRFRFIAQ